MSQCCERDFDNDGNCDRHRPAFKLPPINIAMNIVRQLQKEIYQISERQEIEFLKFLELIVAQKKRELAERWPA